MSLFSYNFVHIQKKGINLMNKKKFKNILNSITSVLKWKLNSKNTKNTI